VNQVVCRYRPHSTNSVLLLCLGGSLPLHFLVSQSQEFVGGLRRIVTDGISNPAIDGQWKVSIDAELLKLLLDAVNDHRYVLCGGFDQEQGEFIAAIPRYEIRAACRFNESVSYSAKDIVSNRISKAVVDIFEVRYVEQQQDYAGLAPFGTCRETAV